MVLGHKTYMAKSVLHQRHHIADAILHVCRHVGEAAIHTIVIPHIYSVLPNLIAIAEEHGRRSDCGIPVNYTKIFKRVQKCLT